MVTQIVTWDTATKGSVVNLSNNNLTAYFSNSRANVRSSIGRANGKYYSEFTLGATSNSYLSIGICPTINYSNSEFISTRSECVVYNGGAGNISISGSIKATVSKFTTGDIISVLIDLDSGTIEFWKNGSSQVIINGIDITKEWVIVSGYESSSNNGTITANFGASPFNFDIPKGYYSYDKNQGGINKFLITTEDNSAYSLVPSETIDLVPKMTSNTAPSGQVIYRNYYSSNYPWYVFNKSTAGHWSPPSGNIVNQYVGYTFPEKQIVNRYSVQFTNSSSFGAAPKEWRLEASSDGLDWITIDTQTDQTNWSTLESRTFDIDNTTPYLSYRIYFLSNNGDASWLYIGSIYFIQIINPSLILLDDSESNFLNHGMGKGYIEMHSRISNKKYINSTTIELGSGKVFKQMIDTSKGSIKQVEIV